MIFVKYLHFTYVEIISYSVIFWLKYKKLIKKPV